VNPTEIALYCGISGARLEDEEAKLGHGVTLRRIARRLTARELADALPEPQRLLHGWRSGEVALTAQLFLPGDFQPPRWLDRVNGAWWFAMLLRLRVSPRARIPLLAADPLTSEGRRSTPGRLWPLEVEERAPWLDVPAGSATSLGAPELDWLRAHWLLSGRRVARHPRLNRAARRLDEAYATGDPQVAFLALCRALETLLSPAGEPSPRLPSHLEGFLGEPRTADAMEDLEAERARAEDGVDPEPESLARAYDLVRRVLLKVIEEDHVPTEAEIQAGSFRAGAH
jgi:hypothetical protein